MDWLICQCSLNPCWNKIHKSSTMLTSNITIGINCHHKIQIQGILAEAGARQCRCTSNYQEKWFKREAEDKKKQTLMALTKMQILRNGETGDSLPLLSCIPRLAANWILQLNFSTDFQVMLKTTSSDSTTSSTSFFQWRLLCCRISSLSQLLHLIVCT